MTLHSASVAINAIQSQMRHYISLANYYRGMHYILLVKLCRMDVPHLTTLQLYREDAFCWCTCNLYEKLPTQIDETPSHDVLLIMGDLNAKVGSKNKGRENIMGKHGIGVMNDNGERLTSFCQENRLLIGGTISQHKDIHKLTWMVIHKTR